MKVVIADDEVRICQLIQALVDWEALGLEVCGTAHNGLEAMELVRKQRPDILITDIRMPGCSGLELIGQVKACEPELEIVIISGYAHFEYAQQAIRYGVGDYLLKPINKAELTATLEKLREKICERRERDFGGGPQLRRTEKDAGLLQEGLVQALMAQEKRPLSLEILAGTYAVPAKEGLFRAFRVKMDCGSAEQAQSSFAVLMEKTREIVELGLRGRGWTAVACVQGLTCAGLVNYPEADAEELPKLFRGCLGQLELQKSLFRPVSFSAALGSADRDPEGLWDSMKEAALLIEERLVRGTGRLFERMGQPGMPATGGMLDRYLREMTQAVEVLSPEQMSEAVCALRDELLARKEVRGYEVLETAYSAAGVFAVKMQLADRTEFLAGLQQQCGRCGSTAEVFERLREMTCSCIVRAAEKQENEAIRPIRKAKQYIQEHYSEPITQEEVSSEAGLSPAYFSVLFKKTEGEGFAKYLIRVRMEQAKILLRETNLPVAEVCRRVGYNDLKYFTHTFEKSAGVKPAVYRKLYG